MADDRSLTGSAATDGDVHDDDELADVLAAELERYATGAVPTLERRTGPVFGTQPAEPPMQPLSVPRIDAAPPQERERRREVPAPAATRAEVAPQPVPERAADARRPRARPEPTAPAETRNEAFRRPERPSGRRSATGAVEQPVPALTADDLPIKRRTGFRPPPIAVDPPPIEPLDRVLPTGPISLPEPTASLLDSMITGSIPVVPAAHADTVAPTTRPTAEESARSAKHAAPSPEPPPQTGAVLDPLRSTGPLAVPGTLYEDWEHSLRSIGLPRAPWEIDDEIVPTGGDPELATMALQLPRIAPSRGAHTAPVPEAPVEPRTETVPPAPERLQETSVPDAEPLRRRRSGRRRAAEPDAADPDPAVVERVPTRLMPAVEAPAESSPTDGPAPDEPTVYGIEAFFEAPAGAAHGSDDVDDEGLDEVATDFPVVSAATTGAIDLPAVEPRPRTAPVLIERVRTAILHLPVVPDAPTGTGAAALIGRWFGAFASPLALVLAFGLAAAGSGAAAVVALLAGVVPAVPAIVRSAIWSADAADDGAMQETAVLGARAGRAVAVALLLARLAAGAVVLFFAGSTAGAWADRTGALGLTAANAALLGCAVVAALALVCAALPVRITAVLTLLVAVLGAVGTLLVALVLAPTGSDAGPTSASGLVAAAAAGFVAVGLLLVLCGPDVARWRTDRANPVSTAVAGGVSALSGAVVVGVGTVLASRLSGGGSATDEFAGALSDASASALAAPLLVVLLGSALTLPALLFRSSGAAATRLLGDGRQVRLGTVAAGMLALAGALALLSAGVDPVAAGLAAAAVLGVPLAAWAGLLVLAPSVRRPLVAAVGLGVAVLLGWVLSDGLLPGASSPVLDVLGLGASSGLRGGPAIGLLVAFAAGIGSAAAAGPGRRTPRGRTAGPADTVEG